MGLAQRLASFLLVCTSVLGADFNVQSADGTLHTNLGFDPDFVSTFAAGPVPEFRILSESDLDLDAIDVEPSVPTNNRLRSRVVGPTDDRVLWNNQDFPYSAMGRLIWQNGVYCSATLIGARHLSTARHCTPTGGESWGWARFQPDYYDGERLGGAYVTLVFYYTSNWDSLAQCSSCWVQDDWVLMLLDTRLGDTVGYLGAKALDRSTQLNRAMFFNFGYPGDLGGGSRPYRQEGITVFDADDCSTAAPGPLRTDTDASGGQSGGPLWLLESGLRYQYGTTSCTSTAETTFGGGSTFVGAISGIRQSYP